MNTIPYYQKEKLDIKPEAAPKEKELSVEKSTLSENIQRFDKKVRVYKGNPYSYNAVSLKKHVTNMTPTQMVTDPLYNQVGKVLGTDTVHDWNKNYDKIHKVIEIAKEKSGIKDSDKLVSWIYSQVNKAPSLGKTRLDDVYIYLRLGQIPKEKSKTKVIVKKIVKYVERKPKQEESQNVISNWMQSMLGGNNVY